MDGEESAIKINTMEKNMEKFNQMQIKDATVTRKFQDSAGLTTKAMTCCINNKLMNNMPITNDSIKHAIQIQGPIEVNIKGKNTEKK